MSQVGDFRGVPKSPTDSLQDIDGLLIMQARKPKESSSWEGKKTADFSICLLLRNKIELQVPPNQKNLLNTQGFPLSFHKSHDRITKTKWKQNNLKKNETKINS